MQPGKLPAENIPLMRVAAAAVDLRTVTSTRERRTAAAECFGIVIAWRVEGPCFRPSVS